MIIRSNTAARIEDQMDPMVSLRHQNDTSCDPLPGQLVDQFGHP